MSRHIRNILDFSPAGAPYVYISSISAFGMRDAESQLRNYFLAYSRYAADKRYLERAALSGSSRRNVYVLRLGQVHGQLQTVSREFAEEILSGAVYLPFAAATDSYTVFCFTIAEALVNIALGKEKPGRYTLVSTPFWSWAQVYEYWASWHQLKLKLLIDNSAALAPVSVFRSLLRTGFSPVAVFKKAGFKYRELLMNYLSFGCESLQIRMQAEYLRRKAAFEITQRPKSKSGGVQRKFWTGRIPGRLLSSLSDSRSAMGPATAAVKDIISKVTE
jgi:hypothetical protein